MEMSVNSPSIVDGPEPKYLDDEESNNEQPGSNDDDFHKEEYESQEHVTTKGDTDRNLHQSVRTVPSEFVIQGDDEKETPV